MKSYRSPFSRNGLTLWLGSFRQIEQEGTGQVLFPLALRGKAFGFSGLSETAVMTPVIINFSLLLIIR